MFTLTTILLPFKFESIHCQVCVPWKVVIFTQGMTVEQSYVQLNSNAIQPDIMGREEKPDPQNCVCLPPLTVIDKEVTPIVC